MSLLVFFFSSHIIYEMLETACMLPRQQEMVQRFQRRVRSLQERGYEKERKSQERTVGGSVVHTTHCRRLTPLTQTEREERERFWEAHSLVVTPSFWVDKLSRVLAPWIFFPGNYTLLGCLREKGASLLERMAGRFPTWKLFYYFYFFSSVETCMMNSITILERSCVSIGLEYTGWTLVIFWNCNCFGLIELCPNSSAQLCLQ